MKIGELAKKTSLSIDTLRYYEKIGLLTGIDREASGYRNYGEHNIHQVFFIRNAQHSGFSLEEISQLLMFRQTPIGAKTKTRALALEKVAELTEKIDTMTALRDELASLVKQCIDEDSHCAIIDKFSD